MQITYSRQECSCGNEVCEVGPHILTHLNQNFSPRTYVALNNLVELKGKHQEQLYEVKCNSFLSNQYPYIGMMHIVYILSNHVSTIVPFILVNFFVKVYILGFWEKNRRRNL